MKIFHLLTRQQKYSIEKKKLGLTPAFCFKIFFFCDLFHHLTIYSVKLVGLHDNKVSIRYLINHLVIRQMQIFHERCNLSEHTGITCYFCCAIRPATFLAKPDSIRKFSVEIKESAIFKASMFSPKSPFDSSSYKSSLSLMSQERA